MHRTIVYILLFMIWGCGQHHTQSNLTGNISNDLHTLFPEGTAKIQIMDSVVQSEREIILSDRMQRALEKNKDWYTNYLSQYSQEPVLPYHPNFGLSSSEYDELMKMKLNVNLLPSATVEVKISNLHSEIHFNTDGKIPYLDLLVLDPEHNKLFMTPYTLVFADTVLVDHENHGLHSRWKGYSWRFEDPAPSDTLNETLDSKHYKITAGVLFKSGNPLIIINKHEETDGETTLNFNKPLVFIYD